MYTQGCLINTGGFFDDDTTIKQTMLFTSGNSLKFYVEAVLLNEELRNITNPVFDATRQAGIIYNAPDETAEFDRKLN